MKPTTRRWLFLAIGGGLLAGATFWSEPINVMRVDHKLVAASIAQDAHPDAAMDLLMSLFRAPVLTVCWQRASKLKEEGRYFDALQLSQWICKLEPRFASVWVFNAWNMAYNISVTLNSPEERWRWVKNGIALLRDQAIPNNPHNTALYKELAWLYFHKVADIMDDKHWYYKNEFALSIEDTLGPGGEYDWNALAAAPHEWKALEKDPQAAALLREMRDLHFDVSQPGVLLGMIQQRAEARTQTQPAEPPLFWAVLDDPKYQPALRNIEYYWRSRRLREEFKIDPQRVVELRKTYGPLDFRLAEAHALYWADTGVQLGRDRATRVDVEKLNTDRIELYCLQNMARRGKLVLSPEARKGVPPLLLPDPRFIRVFIEANIEISKHYRESELNKNATVSENFDSGFKNFVRDAIRQLYEAGDVAGAQYYFDWMREHYPHPDFDRGMENFVNASITGMLKYLTAHQSQGQVVALIQQALRLFAFGRDVEGLNYLRSARRVYDAYNGTVRGTIHLPDFDRIIDANIAIAKEQMPPEAYQRLADRFSLAKAAASRPAAAAP